MHFLSERFRQYHAACFVEGELSSHNGIMTWFNPFVNGMI